MPGRLLIISGRDSDHLQLILTRESESEARVPTYCLLACLLAYLRLMLPDCALMWGVADAVWRRVQVLSEWGLRRVFRPCRHFNYLTSFWELGFLSLKVRLSRQLSYFGLNFLPAQSNDSELCVWCYGCFLETVDIIFRKLLPLQIVQVAGSLINRMTDVETPFGEAFLGG